MTPRQRWKAYWRQYRIIIRECRKAQIDMIAFGTGTVLITDEPDYVKYIPFEELRYD